MDCTPKITESSNLPQTLAQITTDAKKCAYVFSMFIGDAYLEGVLVLAHSILETKTEHDVVCMVTADVSSVAKEKMRLLGIKVVDIEYLEADARLEERPLMKKRYPKIGKYHTKWNCLGLTEYRKVLLLDIDMLMIKKADHVFDLPDPATRFAVYDGSKRKHDQFRPLFSHLEEHDGKEIPLSVVSSIMHSKGGAIDGGCMLVTPSEVAMSEYKEFLNKFDPRNYNCHPTDDEVGLLHFLSTHRKQTWHYLSEKWSCVEWKIAGRVNASNSFLLNFIGLQKPWEADLSHFPDVIPWYRCRARLQTAHPELFPVLENGKARPLSARTQDSPNTSCVQSVLPASGSSKKLSVEKVNRDKRSRSPVAAQRDRSPSRRRLRSRSPPRRALDRERSSKKGY
jgi:hypothetical protein